MPAQAGIQYAAASLLKHKRLWILDRPVKPGDDESGLFEIPIKNASDNSLHVRRDRQPCFT
jgi:hypothetical protein